MKFLIMFFMYLAMLSLFLTFVFLIGLITSSVALAEINVVFAWATLISLIACMVFFVVATLLAALYQYSD